MELLDRFRSYILKENLFQPEDKLLLAVSGGVDSVVLVELCQQAGYDFIIAHCNFKLRGAESDGDEAFVSSLGEKYGVEVLVKQFDTEKYATENKCSIQVAARELRYNWFAELLQKFNTDFNPEDVNGQRATTNLLLTAHHADDNVETLLMNFFKGTGIQGLHGILPRHNKLVRPLLFANKYELLAFASQHQLAYREDSSNASDKYTRNYFRLELIPALEQVFPQVKQNLLHNIDRFREVEILYRQAIDLQKKKLVEVRGNEWHMPLLKLKKTKALNTVLFEIIKDVGFTARQVPDVMGLLQSETGKYVESATHRIFINRNWLIMSPKETVEADNVLIEATDKKVNFQRGTIRLETVPAENFKLAAEKEIAQLDAGLLDYPLLLRKWKPGDYLYPLGMQKKAGGKPGKKKLSRFFNDLKLSLIQREKVWVVEMDKKIIWVVGHRIDDRFKITPNTKEVLQLTLTLAE